MFEYFGQPPCRGKEEAESAETKRVEQNRSVFWLGTRLGEKPRTIGESYDISISPRETLSGGSNSSGRTNNPFSIPRDKKRSESVIDVELVNSEPTTCKSFHANAMSDYVSMIVLKFFTLD